MLIIFFVLLLVIFTVANRVISTLLDSSFFSRPLMHISRVLHFVDQAISAAIDSDIALQIVIIVDQKGT